MVEGITCPVGPISAPVSMLMPVEVIDCHSATVEDPYCRGRCRFGQSLSLRLLAIAVVDVIVVVARVYDAWDCHIGGGFGLPRHYRLRLQIKAAKRKRASLDEYQGTLFNLAYFYFISSIF